MAVEVVLFLAASLTSERSLTHPSGGTASDAFSALFRVGAVALLALGLRALFRQGTVRRLLNLYAYQTPGLGEAEAAVQIGTASDRRLEQLSEQSRAAEDSDPG